MAQGYVDRAEPTADGLSNSPASDTAQPSKPLSRLASSAQLPVAAKGTSEAALLRQKIELLTQQIRIGQSAVEEIQDSIGDNGQALKAEADMWRERYKTATAFAEAKQAKLEELERELESTRGKVKHLQSRVEEEEQKVWELQYDVRDARQEMKTMEHRLQDSIPARLQGEARDDDDDESTTRTSFLQDLPWQRYENATIRNLKDKLKELKKDRRKRE